MTGISNILINIKTMRKVFAFYLLLCCFAPLAIEAKKKSFGNGLFWEITDSGVLIISGNGQMPNFFSYKSSKSPWCQDKKIMKVHKIVIEEGVTSIGDYAFSQVPYCRSCALPSSLKRIGDNAFERSSIESITIPESVTDFGHSIFLGCKNLTSFTIPSNWKKIPSGFLCGCNNLLSIIIPEGIEVIENSAFQRCWSLKKLRFPSTLKRIDSEAFRFAFNLEEVIFNENIESIGKSAFLRDDYYGYTAQKSIKIVGDLPSDITESSCMDIGFTKDELSHYKKEKAKRDKERAITKYEKDAHYQYVDSSKTHRVWCNGSMVEDRFIALCTSIKGEPSYAPTLNIDFPLISKDDFGGIRANLSEDGLQNMLLKICLSNGEVITTNEMTIYKSWLGVGFRLSASLVSMRSDRQSLFGDISGIRYLIMQLTCNNIESITFKGRYTIKFSMVDTKDQLLYDFQRLADESGRLDILPE